MTGIIRGLFISLLLTTFFACAPDPIIVDNIDPEVGTIAVSSYTILDSNIVLGLSRSFSGIPEGNEYEDDFINQILVDSADVYIAHDGEVFESINISPGLYMVPFVALTPNEEYTLIVNDLVNSERSIRATEKYVSGVVLNKVEGEVSVILDSIQYVLDFEVQFEDPPGPNWYMINIDQEFDLENLDSLFTLTSLLERGPSEYMIFSDQDLIDQGLLIDGGTFNDVITYYPFSDEYRADSTILFNLSSISEGYYNYLSKKLELQNVIPLVTEPFKVAGNVENGFGYFNLNAMNLSLLTLTEKVD